VAVTGSGSFNAAVTWATSNGTISSAGVLAAPSVTSITPITVTAISVQDSVTGTVVVSVTPPVTPPPTPPGVTGVTVTCQSPISSGAASQCAASVSPSTVAQTVTWTDSAGTISATGVFTAPTVTTTTNITVTATSNADTTKNGNFIVVVNAPPATPPPMSMDLGDSDGQSPVIVQEANAVDVAWVGASSAVIHFSRSAGGGSFTESPILTTVPVGKMFLGVSLQVDSNLNVYLLWNDSDGNTTLSTSHDHGATFTNHLVTNLLDDNPLMSYDPHLIVDSSNNLDIVWNDTAFTTVFVNQSTDGGVTLGPAISLTTGVTESAFGGLSVVLGPTDFVFVAYVDQNPVNQGDCQIWVGTTSGTSTSMPVNISNKPGVCGATPELLFDSEGNLNAVWNSSEPAVYFSRLAQPVQAYSTGEPGWPGPATVVSGAGGSISGAQVAVEGTTITAVWNASFPTPSVLYSQSSDGLNFNVPTLIQQSAVNSGPGDVTISGCTAGSGSIISFDDSGNFPVSVNSDSDIYVTNLVGNNFTPVSDISLQPATNVKPILSTLNGLTYVAWNEIALVPNVSQLYLEQLRSCSGQ
jgi:hypothetical protein